MIGIRRLPRNPHADHGHDVRGAVGQRVEAVRQDADRASRRTQGELGNRDDEIEDEDPRQHAGHGSVAIHDRWAGGCGVTR